MHKSSLSWQLLIVACLLVLSIPVIAAPTKYAFSGYVQARATDTFSNPAGATAVSTFQVRRAYAYLRASVDEHITGTLLLATVPDAHIEHAYVEYAAKPMMYRAGLVPVPFGYEAPISSSRLVTLERSQITTDLFTKNAGGQLYFMDRGAFVYYLPGKGINVSAAVVDGLPVNNGITTTASATNDNNENKPVVARVGYYIPGGEIGLSAFNGNRVTTLATTTLTAPVGGGTVTSTAVPAASTYLNAYALDLETQRGPLSLLAEAVKAKEGAVSKSGGYVTVAYRAKGSASQPYLRYDIMDANTDTPNNSFSRITAGYAYFLTPTTKLSGEYEMIDADTGFAPAQPASRATAQMMVIF
jgi:hypothetical protein